MINSQLSNSINGEDPDALNEDSSHPRSHSPAARKVALRVPFYPACPTQTCPWIERDRHAGKILLARSAPGSQPGGVAFSFGCRSDTRAAFPGRRSAATGFSVLHPRAAAAIHPGAADKLLAAVHLRLPGNRAAGRHLAKLGAAGGDALPGPDPGGEPQLQRQSSRIWRAGPACPSRSAICCRRGISSSPAT